MEALMNRVVGQPWHFSLALGCALILAAGCTTQQTQPFADLRFITLDVALTSRAYANLAFPTTDPLDELPLGTRLSSLPRTDPGLGPVCSMVADDTIQVRSGVTGALFDLREPNNPDNGDLQAALKRLPGGNPCNGVEIDRLEIRLSPGLRIGVPTSSGTARARSSNGDMWQVIDFQFKLDGVDLGFAPSRSRATFKFMATRPSDSSTALLVRGTFRLPEYDFNPSFF
jgi:hypothetical protein